MIRAELARVPEFRARFRREAAVAQRVARFCTAEVLDVVDPADGAPYLVTEYIDGPTLTQAVARGGPLPSADLERVAVSVAAALTAIHAAGLIHRDLKPSNVLLSPLGPRVIDFGIARVADAETVISKDLHVVGTPAFMAPEQAIGDPVTAAADIFSWGGLVTFAGTGSYPFGEGPTHAQLYRVVHHEPNLDGLPDMLRSVVESAMHKAPNARPSAQELLIRLVNLGTTTKPDPEVTQLVRTASASLLPPQVVPPDNGTSQTQAAPAAVSPTRHAGDRITVDQTDPGSHRRRRLLPWRSPLGRAATVACSAVALVVATVIAIMVMLPTNGSGTDVRGWGEVARKVAADADATRGVNATLAARLSLAAYRISPGPQTRASLITSFAGRYAKPLTGHTVSILGGAFSPDGNLFATASADRTVALWDVTRPAQPTLLATLTGHTDWVLAVAFHPDGRTLATGGFDGTVRLWDITDLRKPVTRATLTGHNARVRDVAFSPDGRLLATAGDDNTARLWDVTDRTKPRQLSVLARHQSWVQDVAFSSDGRRLATASADNTARLWDVSEPTQPIPLASLNGHTDYVWTLAFSPDGNTLATGSYDGTVRLWDVRDGRAPTNRSTIKADPRWVLDTAFSRDGRMLVTSGWDTTAHLWDVSAPDHPLPAGVISGHTDWVQGLALHPDGHTLITFSDDRTARIATIDPDELATRACADDGNRLSAAEWAAHIPALPYSGMC